VLRASDTIARLGGDEFAVVLPDMPNPDTSGDAAARLLDALKEPFVVGGLALEVEASIGIALFPENGKRVSALLRAADVAMYAAKDAHSGYAFYSPDQHRYNPQRLALVSELRRAIDEDELVLHFQPRADIENRRVTAVEALARWEHPQRGLLSPDEFVPLAEHTSLLRPMTIHLLALALRHVRLWHDEGIELTVGVNLSMRNLLDLQLPDDVSALLRQAGVPASALELEITESMVMAEPKRTLAVLNRLSELGVRLAIDDFGTGYSSLAYLKQLPVTSIKIDKSFVLGMADDPGDAVIVESTVHLGHNLGLEVVAEGVETDDVWGRLAAMGCDSAQGYLLSKALPPAELTRWLSAYQSLFDPSREPDSAAR
jgi:predicted signal transduction protein with EAL and GGDEF domain